MLRRLRLPLSPQLRSVLHIGCRRVFGLLHLHPKHIARTEQIARKEHHRLVGREPQIRLLAIIVVTQFTSLRLLCYCGNSLLHKYYSYLPPSLANVIRQIKTNTGESGMELEALNRRQAANGEVNWVTAIFMGLFHVGAIAALFFFTWKALFLSLFMWWVSGSLGIGMAYHRLLTHRGYKTPKWVEYFLTTCATLALEGGPIFWVATHRIHHKYSDQDGDPHSPLDGKWWSHMGWILTGKSMHHDTTTLARFVPDLAKDKFHVWITKYHYVPIAALGLVLLV